MAKKKTAHGKEYLKLVANKDMDHAMLPPKTDQFGGMPARPIQKQFNVYDLTQEFFKSEDFE